VVPTLSHTILKVTWLPEQMLTQAQTLAPTMTILVFMALMAKNFGLMRMLCLTSRLDGMVRLAKSLILEPDWYTAGIATMIQSLVGG
jgi:hypothetical protein